MFFIGDFIFESLFHMFEGFLPLIVIGLIVSLIMRNSKGKQTAYGYVKPGEVLMEGADESAKVSNPNNAPIMNILLYIGSFLIVGSILLFIKDEPSLVPFITIFATIITYTAGILLYRFVEYLRPVATAFTYTSMVLFPLWHYAFVELGMPGEAALFTSTTITLGAYIGAAAGIDSRIAGWLSYIWLLLFGWTGASIIDAHSNSHSFLTYAFFIWPLLVAIFPAICWSFRVKWLPVAYRKATMFFGKWLAPIFAGFSLLTLFVPNMGHEYPALRMLAGTLAVANGIISWGADRKNRGALLALRLYIQLLILMILADITNYPISFSKFETADVAIAITWLVTSLGQTICSLFLPQRTDKEKSIEKGALVFSLISIFSTWIFCANFDPTPHAIVICAIAAVIAVLGALISWRYKNISWANATVLAVMFIPFEIFSYLLPAANYDWAIFFTYLVITLVFIGLYAIINSSSKQKERCLGVATTAVVTGSLACLIVSTDTGWGATGWLTASIFSVLLAVIAKKRALLESSVYLAALSLAGFADSISRTANLRSDSAIMSLTLIQANIIALPLIIFGFIKERQSVGGARKILGVIALAAPAFLVASEANIEHNYILPLIAIFEFVGLTILGVFAKHNWIAITSAVLVTLTTLEMTGGFTGVWLLILGIGLIAFVAWQLTKNNKKPQQ